MNKSGFTLVELLITVAIIGILAAVGVPSYKRSLQKAKTAEAKTLLAAISVGESVFSNEYGTYGNNIARMGVQVDGTNFVYAAGVGVNGGCAQQTAWPTIAPGNFSSYLNDVGGKVNMIGSSAYSTCYATAVATTTYSSSATGALRKLSDDANCTDGAATDQCDVWTMTQDRVLINQVDGIK